MDRNGSNHIRKNKTLKKSNYHMWNLDLKNRRESRREEEPGSGRGRGTREVKE
jgi:hypothetical protein